MSPWWLLAIIPGYLFTIGLARGYIHHRPQHDQQACDVWEDLPCVLIALIWPVALVVILMISVAVLGGKTEALRPRRRRGERDKKIARDEGIVYYGKALDRGPE
jgi:hypothetical protein